MKQAVNKANATTTSRERATSSSRCLVQWASSICDAFRVSARLERRSSGPPDTLPLVALPSLKQTRLSTTNMSLTLTKAGITSTRAACVSCPRMPSRSFRRVGASSLCTHARPWMSAARHCASLRPPAPPLAHVRPACTPIQSISFIPSFFVVAVVIDGLAHTHTHTHTLSSNCHYHSKHNQHAPLESQQCI